VSIRFGDYVLATEARELRRGDGPVALTPKAFQLLELLLEKRPRAVSKAQIHERLWPSTFVSEVNLASLAFEIRAAIGDDARHPRYIRTVRGFGYAFCGEASAATVAGPAASGVVCRLFWGDREVALRPGENILGRSPAVAVWVDSTTVSRHHARIIVTGAEAALEDLGSKNGTTLNGRRVEAPTTLADRDEIRLGSVRILFRVVGEAGSTATGRVE
jgi:DNA-binding winged helix-turn-helix (wHTH) protein